MGYLDQYDILVSGLKSGNHDLTFKVEDEFFSFFENEECLKGTVDIKVILEKHSKYIVLHLEFTGFMDVACDICLNNYNQDISYQGDVFVKFDDEEYDELDDVIVLPKDTTNINIAQYLFEYIYLSLPFRKVHPDNNCDSSMIETLNQLSVNESHDEQIDPRWLELKKLN